MQVCSAGPTEVQLKYKRSRLELKGTLIQLKILVPTTTTFTRSLEQRWSSLYSWFSKILAHFARLPYPRSAPPNSDFLAPMVLKSTAEPHCASGARSLKGNLSSSDSITTKPAIISSLQD